MQASSAVGTPAGDLRIATNGAQSAHGTAALTADSAFQKIVSSLQEPKMDKYRKTAEKKLKGQHPDLIAKEALSRAEFSSRQREEFFEDAYGELLVDYFLQFLNTEPHENKKREFIYSCVLSWVTLSHD